MSGNNVGEGRNEAPIRSDPGPAQCLDYIHYHSDSRKQRTILFRNTRAGKPLNLFAKILRHASPNYPNGFFYQSAAKAAVLKEPGLARQAGQAVAVKMAGSAVPSEPAPTSELWQHAGQTSNKNKLSWQASQECGALLVWRAKSQFQPPAGLRH